jgi:type IV pilus assembly protein PilW
MSQPPKSFPDQAKMNIVTLKLKHTRSAGFSLVELMVALVIGLIGTLVMFQVLAVSESHKRTTVSGGDAQQNGAVALYTMERDLRNAAHGMNALISLGRPMYTWSNASNTVLPPVIFRPLVIRPGLDSDSIEVNYSTSTGLTAPTPIMVPWDAAGVPIPNVQVVRVVGFGNGDQVALCPDLSAQPTAVCIRGEVTGVIDIASTGRFLTLAPPPTAFVVNGTTTRASLYNPPAGFVNAIAPRVFADGLTLPNIFNGDGVTQSIVFNLGEMISHTYSVQNGQLMLNDGENINEFADGIISLRAQYGLDTNNDGAVDAWVNPRGASPVNERASFTPNHGSFLITTDLDIAGSWRMVIAARVAVITRSSNMEKDAVETRSTIPLWTNPTGNPAPSFTVPSGDGNRYRYKVFETVVPFRNMIWRN